MSALIALGMFAFSYFSDKPTRLIVWVRLVWQSDTTTLETRKIQKVIIGREELESTCHPTWNGFGSKIFRNLVLKI